MFVVVVVGGAVTAWQYLALKSAQESTKTCKLTSECQLGLACREEIGATKKSVFDPTKKKCYPFMTDVFLSLGIN